MTRFYFKSASYGLHIRVLTLPVAVYTLDSIKRDTGQINDVLECFIQCFITDDFFKYTMDSLYNVIDKSITHSFNFDDIELVPVDDHPNVTASLRGTHNVEIPCDTLLSAVYNVKFLEVLDKPVYIDGTYPAWLSKNHDVFPEYYTKNIQHPTLGIWHWTREDTELNGRGKVAVRGDLTLSHEASLKFAEFQYVSNMNPQAKKLNDDVLACVNAIISHVSGAPYNHDT